MGNEQTNKKEKVSSKQPSASELKTFIMIVQSRLTQNRNKKVEVIKRKKQEIAKCLQDNTLDIAKAKMESVLREEDIITVYDILGPLCEILKEKVTYLLMNDKCPDDLRATLDTIIYASTRIEIDELHKVREMVQRKYGDLYISKSNSNSDLLVNVNVVEKLKVKPYADQYVVFRLKQLIKDMNISFEFPQEIPQVINMSDFHDESKIGGNINGDQSQLNPQNLNQGFNQNMSDFNQQGNNFNPSNYNPNYYNYPGGQGPQQGYNPNQQNNFNQFNPQQQYIPNQSQQQNYNQINSQFPNQSQHTSYQALNPPNNNNQFSNNPSSTNSHYPQHNPYQSQFNNSNSSQFPSGNKSNVNMSENKVINQSNMNPNMNVGRTPNQFSNDNQNVNSQFPSKTSLIGNDNLRYNPNPNQQQTYNTGSPYNPNLNIFPPNTQQGLSRVDELGSSYVDSPKNSHIKESGFNIIKNESFNPYHNEFSNLSNVNNDNTNRVDSIVKDKLFSNENNATPKPMDESQGQFKNNQPNIGNLRDTQLFQNVNLNDDDDFNLPKIGQSALNNVNQGQVGDDFPSTFNNDFPDPKK